MAQTMLIKAQSITKAFGPHKVLKDVSLQINEGDSIGLIGVNGAGKTTFLKIMLGEMKPDTGELTRNTERIGYLERHRPRRSRQALRPHREHQAQDHGDRGADDGRR